MPLPLLILSHNRPPSVRTYCYTDCRPEARKAPVVDFESAYHALMVETAALRAGESSTSPSIGSSFANVGQPTLRQQRGPRRTLMFKTHAMYPVQSFVPETVSQMRRMEILAARNVPWSRIWVLRRTTTCGPKSSRVSLPKIWNGSGRYQGGA